MINCLNKTNFLIDKSCNELSQRFVLPTIKSTYHTAAHFSADLAGLFSEKLQKIADNLFYDPLSAQSVLFFTKRVEVLTAYQAMRTPLQCHRFIEYLDRSLISMNQHLYSYTTRVNDLLRVPLNLKKFLNRFTFKEVLNQVRTNTPNYLNWTGQLALEIKHFVLALLDLAIELMDFFFKILFLKSKFGVFSYLKDLVINAQNNIYTQVTTIATQSIENRKTQLRRLIFANIAGATTDYLGTLLTYVGVRSLLGLAVYIPTKNLLRDHAFASEWVVHTIGAAILTRTLWNAAIKPTCDPYYEAYNPKFESDGVSFKELCEYFGLQNTYPIAAFAGYYFGASQDSNDTRQQLLKAHSSKAIA